MSIDVTAIIVNYNTGHLIEPVLTALRASADGLNLQVLVIDNASRDDSRERLLALATSCQVIQNDVNVGFGRANNQALPCVQGRFLLLLNTDAFVEPQTLRLTVDYMDTHPKIGVLGVKLVGRDGELQPCCRYFPTPSNAFFEGLGIARWIPGIRTVDDMDWRHDAPRECDWVPGCYYLIRREVVSQVGLFDPRYFLYYEEVDHCRAVKAAGWSVVYYPHTKVVHWGGESAKSDGILTSAGRQLSELQAESQLLFFRKHHGRFGVFVVLVASLFSELKFSLKAMLRGRKLIAFHDMLKNTLLLISAGLRTRWGKFSTR